MYFAGHNKSHFNILLLRLKFHLSTMNFFRLVQYSLCLLPISMGLPTSLTCNRVSTKFCGVDKVLQNRPEMELHLDKRLVISCSPS